MRIIPKLVDKISAFSKVASKNIPATNPVKAVGSVSNQISPEVYKSLRNYVLAQVPDIKIPKFNQLKQTLLDNKLYEAEDIKNILLACKNEEQCELAFDIVSNIDFKIDVAKLKFLNLIKEQSEEKYECIKNSKALLEYLKQGISTSFDFEENLLNKLELSDYSKIENAVETVLKEPKYKSGLLSGMVKLKVCDEETYNYLVKSKIIDESCFANILPSFGIIDVDANCIKEIEKAISKKTGDSEFVRNYVHHSDSFLVAEKNRNKLRKLISKFKLDNDIHVVRGDKTPWMFDSVSIKDTQLEKDAKEILSANMKKIKWLSATSNVGRFSGGEELNLYEYLSTKNEYSLADAMHLARFGDDKYIQNVCETIKNAQVADDRFKSVTLSSHFANAWLMSKDSDIPKIYSDLTLKQGLEAMYDSKTTSQKEFIINDCKKLFEFTNAFYDKDKNRFILKGSVSKINK